MDWQEEVSTALRAIPNATACFIYPVKWPEGTVITYSGLNDVPAVIADDKEYSTEITVKIDVWDEIPGTVKDTVKLVKQAMAGLDFKRTYCFDLFETGSRLHHTTMRFTRGQAAD